MLSSETSKEERPPVAVVDKHRSPSVWPHAEEWVAEDEGAHRSLLSQNVPHYRARLPENNSYLALAFDMHKKSITQNKNDDRSLNRGVLWKSRPTVLCFRKAFTAIYLDFMHLSNTKWCLTAKQKENDT